MPLSCPASPTSTRCWPRRDERCVEILARFLGDDLDRGAIASLAAAAFDFPLPFVAVERDTFALELFHGPSLAFKDFGARLLAGVLALLRDSGQLLPLATVLVATSGDTGAAVAHAFWRRPGFRVVVLYPRGRVSPSQEGQFASLGDNIEALAVQGGFDDCQALVKACLVDPALALECGLTSANSINVARLLAQVLYYFEIVARLRARGSQAAPVVAVPSGNFGNLCAGLLAHRLGLPIEALVAATNANRTVPEYLDRATITPRQRRDAVERDGRRGAQQLERVESLFGGRHDGCARCRVGQRGRRANAETLHELRGKGYLADFIFGRRLCAARPVTRRDGRSLATAHPASSEVLSPAPDDHRALWRSRKCSRPLRRIRS
jgi:threonine synthase